MYCGTSNIVLPVPNKSFFPQEYREKTRLQYYASLFNSLEVNSTFYKLPKQPTTEKWAAEVPSYFRFSVKLWRGVTHSPNLDYSVSDVKKCMDVFNGFGDKKGCLLVQFPAGTKAVYFTKLEKLLGDITILNDNWKLAIEFRDNSWYNDKMYRLLESYQCCLVEHDMPKSATPAEMPRSDTRFIRFHGIAGDYKGSYDDELLNRYAEGITKSEKQQQKVYVYFNNTIGDAVQNALTLCRLYENNL